MRDENKLNQLEKEIVELEQQLRQEMAEASHRTGHPKGQIEVALEDRTFSGVDTPFIVECDPEGRLRNLDRRLLDLRKKLSEERKK